MLILYSTDCPRCKVLKKKMSDKNIVYTEETNIDKMMALGISEVPVLSVDGELMNFTEANKWINNK